MGSCVSVHKDPTKLGFSVGSMTNQEVLIPSPIKDKPLPNGDSFMPDVDVKANTHTSFRSFGSKEDLFFDTQPWLESDCEDDFYSVNGDKFSHFDFTPSRGNTPVHRSFSSALQPKVTISDKVPVVLPEPSPKMRLSELFEESSREHHNIDYQDGADNSSCISVSETSYVSGANSVYSTERTPSKRLTPDKTSVISTPYCLPRLLSIHSYSERKKQLSSGHSVG